MPRRRYPSHQSCFCCDVAWHADLSCEEYQASIMKDANSTTEWITEHTKNCPHCARPTEKIEGCEHMARCPRKKGFQTSGSVLIRACVDGCRCAGNLEVAVVSTAVSHPPPTVTVLLCTSKAHIF